MKKYSFSLLFILVFSVAAFAQYTTLKVADEAFNSFHFATAAKHYEEAYSQKPTVRALVGAAESYYLMRDYQQAEIWYSRLANRDRVETEHILRYGHTLRSNSKYREAKAQYQRLESRSDRSVSLDELEDLYHSCDSAMTWMENPQRIHEIENLRAINSEYTEFGAVPYEGGWLFSSDRRTAATSPDKTYGWTGHAYLSLFHADDAGVRPFHMQWYDATHHVGPPSISKATDEVYFSVTRELDRRERRSASRNATVNIEIYSNQASAEDWGKNPQPFPYNQITEWSVGDPFMTVSGDTLYFVSDMPGGLGGTDIYYVTRRSDGSWSDAVNLGPTVNTAQDERTPSLDFEGNLYFSSAGHVGMGGLDVFVLRKDSRVVENLGYPINSPGDDFSLHFAENFQGTLASNRQGGVGMDDIYRFDMRREIVLDLQGQVRNAKSNLPVAGARVTLTQRADVEERFVLYADEAGIFRYNLRPGADYELTAEQTGFKPFSGIKFDTHDLSTSQRIEKVLLLDPVEEKEVVVLRNIYFDFDEAAIRPDAALELSRILSFLNSDPDVRIELSAHTDSRGSEAYNMELSQRRADAAIAFLTAGGIDPSRLVAKGYGFSQLANHCAPGVTCTEEEHQFNRRVEFFVIGSDHASKD